MTMCALTEKTICLKLFMFIFTGQIDVVVGCFVGFSALDFSSILSLLL